MIATRRPRKYRLSPTDRLVLALAVRGLPEETIAATVRHETGRDIDLIAARQRLSLELDPREQRNHPYVA